MYVCVCVYVMFYKSGVLSFSELALIAEGRLATREITKLVHLFLLQAANVAPFPIRHYVFSCYLFLISAHLLVHLYLDYWKSVC